jgi:hypothetical protein
MASTLKEDPEFVEVHDDDNGYYLIHIKEIKASTYNITIHGYIVCKNDPWIVKREIPFRKCKLSEVRPLTEQEYKNRLFEYVTGKE